MLEINEIYFDAPLLINNSQVSQFKHSKNNPSKCFLVSLTVDGVKSIFVEYHYCNPDFMHMKKDPTIIYIPMQKVKNFKTMK